MVSHFPMPRAISKFKTGRPKGAMGNTSPLRLREILLQACTPEELQIWFRKGLTPKERLDLLAKLEPKEVSGLDGGPIKVRWES